MIRPNFAVEAPYFVFRISDSMEKIVQNDDRNRIQGSHGNILRPAFLLVH